MNKINLSSNYLRQRTMNKDTLKTISTDRNNSSNAANNMSFWEQWRATSGGAMQRTKKDLEYFIDLIYSGGEIDAYLDSS